MGWFALAFLATSLLLILAALIWYGIIEILPLMYQTTTRIEHLRLYRAMQHDVVSVCKDIERGKVLDVGAGTGYLSLPLSKSHPVVAVDASLDMLKYAQRIAKRHKSYIYPVVGMAEALPFKDDSFDAVVSSFALHHFSNLTTSLMGMARVLKTAGYLVLMDIAGRSLASELHRIVTDQVFRMLSRQKWQGYYYLDFDVLKQWLSQSGLEVKNVAVYPHPLPRRLIHLVKIASRIHMKSFSTYYRYGMGMSDEAKVMMFRTKALGLKMRKISSFDYYLMLVKPFFEILAGNLYLGKRLLTHGLQHLVINLSERLISSVDTISFYTPTLSENPRVAAERVKKFAMTKGCDVCGIVDMEYIREKTSVSLAPSASRALIIGKGTLDLEDSGKDVWEVYAQLTKICNHVATFIRKEYGFTAQSLFPFTLGVFFPEMAQAARLGWKGLNNLLVTEEYGAKIRLGVVFTDMPLTCDAQYQKDLCAICPRYCVRVCPVGAISTKGYNFQRCIHYFSTVQGCGLCVGVCPYPSR